MRSFLLTVAATVLAVGIVAALRLLDAAWWLYAVSAFGIVAWLWAIEERDERRSRVAAAEAAMRHHRSVDDSDDGRYCA